MNPFELLKKLKPRGVKLEKLVPPPPSSVYLMIFIAIIGIGNLKAMITTIPDIAIISPIILAMIFGAFYSRLNYLMMIVFVDIGWYLFGDVIFIFPQEELVFVALASNAIAIASIETVRFFWKETVKTSDHLTRMNDFVDELDTVLSSVSESYVLKDGIIETLRLATERFFLSGAYLYIVKDKNEPVAIFHSKYEDPDSAYENEVLFQNNLNSGDLDVSRLIAELSHKDILISSSTSNTSIGKKLRKKYHIKSLVFIALHAEDEISGFLVLLEHDEILNINSLDYRIISIIRSTLEITLKAERQRILNKRLDRTNYEFTKVTLEDTRKLLNKCEEY